MTLRFPPRQGAGIAPIMNSVELEWRLRRLSKMSPSEVKWRISDHVRRKRWASRQVMPEVVPAVVGPHLHRRAAGTLGFGPEADVSSVPSAECCGPFRTTASQRHCRSRRDTGGAVAAPRYLASGHGGTGLVLRSGDRDAGTSGRLLLQGQSSLRGRHGQREADLGALAHAPPDGARGSVQPFGRRALCRTRRLASPFLVGTEPLSLRRALDERNRGRAAADQLGLGAPSARRVGRSR